MADASFKTIQELNAGVQTTFQIKFANYLKSTFASRFCTTIPTKDNVVNLAFIDKYLDLEETGLYDEPAIQTLTGKYIDFTIAKYQKGLGIGRFEYDSPPVSSMFIT